MRQGHETTGPKKPGRKGMVERIIYNVLATLDELDLPSAIMIHEYVSRVQPCSLALVYKALHHARMSYKQLVKV
ncbi:MAG: hypothetical protein EZS28_004187 [Streblomastix strix]|uniref:Uncharacterized protein n=1 Tax=Streblomastix strix TaxID=222440 RepID=A0A5J4WYT0_9EUKA|nr:MAG: hypothetical protein EZS28_004187 [Streblomastix strix]